MNMLPIPAHGPLGIELLWPLRYGRPLCGHTLSLLSGKGLGQHQLGHLKTVLFGSPTHKTCASGHCVNKGPRPGGAPSQRAGNSLRSRETWTMLVFFEDTSDGGEMAPNLLVRGLG